MLNRTVHSFRSPQPMRTWSAGSLELPSRGSVDSSAATPDYFVISVVLRLPYFVKIPLGYARRLSALEFH